MSSTAKTKVLSVAATLALASSAVVLTGAPAQAASQPYFTYANGWRVQQHPRLLADVNGDGRDDIVGFGDQGTYVALGRVNRTFAPPQLRLRDFGYDQGWREGEHPRQLADVNDDGRADVVGFGIAGTTVAYGRTDGGFTAPTLALRDYGTSQGWLKSEHVRELGDVNNDGRADIVGFGYSKTYVSYARVGGGFTAPTVAVNDLTAAQGWKIGEHLRELAYVNGDNRDDIVAFGAKGVTVAYARSTGGFTAPTVRVGDFGTNQGWSEQRTPRVTGDLNGDLIEDLVGFGNAGTYVSYGRFGGGFSAPTLKVADFGSYDGWKIGHHARTLADANGDGTADIVGFGYSGTYVALTQRDGSVGAASLWLREFGNNDGWTVDLYPRVLADVNGDNRADVVGFGYSSTIVEMLKRS
ncbi:VCBS repeat-containing protein [Kocuria atrinae]|uniref:FG-GAP repeat domain-containing protein n=1 Tax=Kocuria atrinae TaxID=592377 RepID=UPI0004CF74E7|nr:VCBS repeat-containing protein [Kocuria atrinae]